ncbi:MAG TPA: c-type cytochrome [Rhodocyclaceae bacterium]|nr:c-type cytochrome [Rhodocyclaceae bacterium]
MTKFLRFTLPVAALVVSGVLVGCNKQEPVSPEETAKLIAPVAHVAMADESAATASAAAPAGKADGKKVFESVCTACHTPGAAGAPKFGDKAAWAPRIATGIDSLYHSALNGKNVMPPRGGNPSLSDAEVKAAVDYMVAAAK